MAVMRNDKLQRLLRNIVIDQRVCNWLWIFLKINYPQEHLGEFRSPAMRDNMANLIQVITENYSEHNLINNIEKIKENALLPKEEISWLSNEKRQTNFALNRITELNDGYHLHAIDNLTGSALFITTLDTWIAPLLQKKYILNQIKNEWGQISSSGPSFKWLDKDDPDEKLQIVWSIAKTKFQALAFLPTPRDKEGLIANLDNAGLNFSETVLLMQSAKRRWSQNKYRAKQTGKKQYNFMLPEKSIKKLDRIAERFNLKRTEVLEILLEMEEANGTHMKERTEFKKTILGRPN